MLAHGILHSARLSILAWGNCTANPGPKASEGRHLSGLQPLKHHGSRHHGPFSVPTWHLAGVESTICNGDVTTVTLPLTSRLASSPTLLLQDVGNTYQACKQHMPSALPLLLFSIETQSLSLQFCIIIQVIVVNVTVLLWPLWWWSQHSAPAISHFNPGLLNNSGGSCWVQLSTPVTLLSCCRWSGCRWWWCRSSYCCYCRVSRLSESQPVIFGHEHCLVAGLPLLVVVCIGLTATTKNKSDLDQCALALPPSDPSTSQVYTVPWQ